jgi:chromosome segregation ATPase
MAANGTKRTARESLEAAKAELPQIERGIELANQVRKRLLVNDESEAMIAEANRHLAYLRQRRDDLADKIEWLPERISAEESEAAWPSSVPALQALIDKLSRRLSALQAKRQALQAKRQPLAAAEDDEIDHLQQRVPALQQRLQQMIKFVETTIQ